MEDRLNEELFSISYSGVKVVIIVFNQAECSYNTSML